MTQISCRNLRYLEGYFSFGVQHDTRKRNAETDSHTTYISKVNLLESPHLIFLDYLLIHLNRCVKGFSLSEVKKVNEKKSFAVMTMKYWEENPLDM